MELKFENERARANIPRLQVSEHYPLIGDIFLMVHISFPLQLTTKIGIDRVLESFCE